MSYSLDVNILLYASDETSPHHARAAEFLDGCVRGSEPMYLAWPTLMGYLRVATHPAIFSNPLPHDQALENVTGLIGLSHVRVLTEGDDFWRVYCEVSATVPVRGNLVPDVYLASLLKQHGVKTLYTRDRDFRKFDFLRARDPLAS